MGLAYEQAPDYHLIKRLLLAEIEKNGGDRVPFDWEYLPLSVRQSLSSVAFPVTPGAAVVIPREEEEEEDVTEPFPDKTGKPSIVFKGGCTACNVA
jgi:hypothetical protein